MEGQVLIGHFGHMPIRLKSSLLAFGPGDLGNPAWSRALKPLVDQFRLHTEQVTTLSDIQVQWNLCSGESHIGRPLGLDPYQCLKNTSAPT